MQQLAVLSLVLLAFFTSAQGTVCSYSSNDWKDDTGYFLDCLTNDIANDVRDVQSRTTRYRSLIARAFTSAQSCQSYFTKPASAAATCNSWSSTFSDDCVLLNVLKDQRNSFFSSTGDVSKVEQAVNIIDNLLWNVIGPVEDLSSCLINFFRDNFLNFMQTCLSRQSNVTDLVMGRPTRLIPATPATNVPYMRSFVNLHIKAYLLLKHCNDADKANIINQLKAETDGEVCTCAKNSFFYCKDNYNQACPWTNACIVQLISKPGVLLNDAKKKATECFFNSRQKPASLTLADVAEPALNVFKLIQSMNDQEKEAFGNFVKNIFESIFTGDLCRTCRL